MDDVGLMVLMCISWLLLMTLPQFLCEPHPPSYDYSLCKEPYKCGNVSSVLFFPFWGQNRPPFCGGGPSFELSCHHDDSTMSVEIASLKFKVEKINTTTKTLRVVPIVKDKDVCSSPFLETYVKLFRYPGTGTEDYSITIFHQCPTHTNFHDLHNFTCGDARYYFGKVHELKDCKVYWTIPAHYPELYISGGGGVGVDDLKYLKQGFDVNYDVPQHCTACPQIEGSCKTDEDVVPCYYCTPQSDAPHCIATSKKQRFGWKVIVGVVSGVVGVLIVGIGVYLFMRRKKNSHAMSYKQSQSLSSDPSSKDTERGTLSFTQSFAVGVHLFSYDELEEATNHFDSSKEIGEGGFGTVYFGQLRDGRSVAVKRLYENNYKRIAQFMNEIRILARLVHPNLVTLYGCTSRHSRELLLVYEYIPNGTVADHLHGQRSRPGKLPWHIRMNIAMETAIALKFLHLNDIIHRDVKTNNILLDNKFCVKVADFGLSRLFPDHVTHVSTAPQGTPGYVDPEYHECYQLTNKSDVYSFGVVLIELISSLPAVDITRHRHEINLANMAIIKIHSQAVHELVDPTLGFESDLKVRKMINAVAELAYRCLQSSKDMRPSMEEVVDTLKDIQNDGKHKSQAEVMDISSTADDVVLLKDDPPPPSPDSNAVSKSTTPNASG